MLDVFQTISLGELKNNSPLLKRVEKKFLVGKEELKDILNEFQNEYYILEIKNKKIFNYNTIYFDNENLNNYYQHNQGKRLRKKIRTRLYEDTNCCFFEIKLKNKRNKIKKRKKIDIINHGVLNNKMFSFANNLILDIYSKGIEGKLKAILQTHYKRITLVSKNFNERITFDFNFKFFNLDNTSFIKEKAKKIIENNDVMIIEIKSNKENSYGQRKLKKKKIFPIEYGCSKYCIGLNLLGIVKKGNKFKPVIKKIKKLSINNSIT